MGEGENGLWQKTTIVVATEFGRTAAANGTGGTDHGTGSVAMILGGDIQGGRVIADWPGLSKLYQDRDLHPTTNLNILFASIVAESFRLDAQQVAKVLFPDTASGKILQGLIRI